MVAKKIITWSISTILILVIAALFFVYVSPDYNMYLVRGYSMAPAVNIMDMVITGPMGGLLGGEIEPGTIVTYERGQVLVTHRVVSVDGESIVTKGDATEDPDPHAISTSDICGVYLLRIPYAGYLSDFMRTTCGWLLMVITPSVLLVGLIVRKIVREATSIA